MGSQTTSQLPVIDFTNPNMKPGTEPWISACHVVRTELENHGFFVARYDKVDEELRESVVSAMEEVYGLSVETKRQKSSDKIFHGYIGQVSFLPLYESLGIDDPLTIEGCQKFARTMWPQGNDRFCESVNEYAKLLGEIDKVAKRMVFESYGVSKKECESFIESTNYLLRNFKYRVAEKGENDVGIDSHTDMGIISVLHQLNNLNGLEVKLKNGEWCQVEASPSTFVVMAGDGFTFWSNGRLRPCEHRVTMKAQKTRYSMGLSSFINGVMQIPEELVDDEHPLRYKPFDHYGYLHFFDKEKIQDAYSRLNAYCGV